MSLSEVHERFEKAYSGTKNAGMIVLPEGFEYEPLYPPTRVTDLLTIRFLKPSISPIKYIEYLNRMGYDITFNSEKSEIRINGVLKSDHIPAFFSMESNEKGWFESDLVPELRQLQMWEEMKEQRKPWYLKLWNWLFGKCYN